MRPKIRRLAQHGWRDESGPTGVILYCMHRRAVPPAFSVPSCEMMEFPAAVIR